MTRLPCPWMRNEVGFDAPVMKYLVISRWQAWHQPTDRKLEDCIYNVIVVSAQLCSYFSTISLLSSEIDNESKLRTTTQFTVRNTRKPTRCIGTSHRRIFPIRSWPFSENINIKARHPLTSFLLEDVREALRVRTYARFRLAC